MNTILKVEEKFKYFTGKVLCNDGNVRPFALAIEPSGVELFEKLSKKKNMSIEKIVEKIKEKNFQYSITVFSKKEGM